jgi:hypothetical protein
MNSSADGSSRRSSADFFGERRQKLLTSFELCFYTPQVQFRSNDSVVVLTMDEAHVNFEQDEQLYDIQTDQPHNNKDTHEKTTTESGMRAVCTNVVGYVTDGTSWIQENSTEHDCLGAPSLIITRALHHGFSPSLSIHLPKLRATTDCKEYNDVVAIVVHVILAPPLVDDEEEKEENGGGVGGKETKRAGGMAAAQNVDENNKSSVNGNNESSVNDNNENKGKQRPMLSEEDISNASSTIRSDMNGRLISTINYNIHEFVWNIVPPSSNRSLQVDMYKLMGHHDYFSVREYNTFDLDIYDLSIQNTKPGETEMISFEDPMSILEAVVSDRAHNVGKRRVKFISIVAAGRTVSGGIGSRMFTMYDRFEVNLFPGATGTIQLQITAQIADVLSTFFAMSNADEDKTEEDASSILFGKSEASSSVVVAAATSMKKEPDKTLTMDNAADTVDEKLYVQKMRLSEVTFVLCARDFTVAIPDNWRVRIKALQLNSLVTDWKKLGKEIIMHFVKKIAKSLVLKNGAKTLVGSLTGVAFKANNTATNVGITAETEEESASLLFGHK